MDNINRSFLDECEREPLHLSGAIQPHGTLLLTDDSGIVSHVAANLTAFLGITPIELLGKPLPAPMLELTSDIDQQVGSRRVHEGAVVGLDGALDIVITRSAQGGLLLELTPQRERPRLSVPALARLSKIPQKEEDQATSRQFLIEHIATLLGAQRVLFYAFHEDGHGEVLAEARERPEIGSYLGLHFPASDIPQIARALYLKNPWRLIPDAAAEPVPLLSFSATPPADLTWSDLRSVSPVHCLYLANMGVRASLSFAVVIGGQLTALVSVHHGLPFQLSALLLEDIAILVRAYALSDSSWQSQQRMRLIDGLNYRFAPVQALFDRHGDFFAAWPEIAAMLMEKFQANGATLCFGEHSSAIGVTFEPAALAAFEYWFCESQSETIWLGDSLLRQVPGFPLSHCAGVLAIRVARASGRGLRLYLTRSEHIHEIAWGGNPDKPVERHDGLWGLAPRRSFEKWIEKRLGYCRPWGGESRLLALKLRELLLREIRA